MADHPDRYAYCTLITRASYLAGVIMLASSLHAQGSAYPLIVLHTPSLPSSALHALELEAPKTNMILHAVDPLQPRANVNVNLIAARFADTWTKLRVFQLHERFPQLKTVCYLDADMMIFRPLDPIFTAHPLPHSDWIAANHACVCNLDGDPWAPADWTADNCAYTPLAHPEALTKPTPVKPDSRPTYHLLNSGMFLFSPSAELWAAMLDFFNTTPLLGEFKFPDQDFLAEFFRNKWASLGWQYNALKTMRYWHPNIWRDDEVVVLHYIVDKPWALRNKPDGTAGYLGRDGVTHSWWWDSFDAWAREREANEVLMKEVSKYVAGAEVVDQDMKDIGAETQKLAGAKVPSE